MAYRNKTLVTFDGDNDIRYYYLMKAWEQSDSTDFNWYSVIICFLRTHPYVRPACISVAKESGKIYWDDVSYSYIVDPDNERILSSCFIDSEIADAELDY